MIKLIPALLQGAGVRGCGGVQALASGSSLPCWRRGGTAAAADVLRRLLLPPLAREGGGTASGTAARTVAVRDAVYSEDSAGFAEGAGERRNQGVAALPCLARSKLGAKVGKHPVARAMTVCSS